MDGATKELLKGKLTNWKFRSALSYLDGQTEEVKDVVNALCRSYGNCGWFEGDMGLIVGICVESVIAKLIETE